MHQVHIYGSDVKENDDEDFEGMEVEIDDGIICPFHLMNFNGSSSSLLSLLYFFSSKAYFILVLHFEQYCSTNC